MSDHEWPPSGYFETIKIHYYQKIDHFNVYLHNNRVVVQHNNRVITQQENRVLV